jgi:hypothetical protein
MASNQPKSSRECIEKIRHSKVKVHDPGTGKNGVLLNPGKMQVRRVRVDGCLAPASTRAADFVVSMPDVVDVIVELKGKNVDHAASQVESTRIFWHSHPEHVAGQPIGAWILCSEFPRASLKAAHYREALRVKGVVLLISTHNGEERAFSEFLPKRP